jgi:hypothetical protein
MAVRLIAFFFLVFFFIAAPADTLTGKVVKITDGDTLYVLDATISNIKPVWPGSMRPNESRRMG